MHWSSGLAKLTQEHTVMRTHTHRSTCTHTHTQSLSHANFSERNSSAHSVQRFSCWPAPLKHRYTHIKLCTCLLATQISSGHARLFFSKKPLCIKLLCCHILLIFTKALFYQNMATLLAPRFLHLYSILAYHICHFGDELQIE